MTAKRELLPLATFEHLQSENWGSDARQICAYDICDRLEHVQNNIVKLAKDGQIILSHDFISNVNDQIVQNLGSSARAEFKQPQLWEDFIVELKAGSDPESITVYACGAWIIAQLYWHHLSVFRLLTAWLIVDGLAIQEQSSKLSISYNGLGRLLMDLSNSGPPIYDAENFRSQINYYE